MSASSGTQLAYGLRTMNDSSGKCRLNRKRIPSRVQSSQENHPLNLCFVVLLFLFCAARNPIRTMELSDMDDLMAMESLLPDE